MVLICRHAIIRSIFYRNHTIIIMPTRPSNRLSSLKQLSPQLYKSIRLSFYILLIWSLHIIASVYTEAIYKKPYPQTYSPNSPDYFHNPIAIPLCNNFFAMVYGFFKYDIGHAHHNYRESTQIPLKYYLRIGGIDVIISLLCNYLIVASSFTTFNLFHCCSLLSVVFVAVMCGRFRADNGHSNTTIRGSQVLASGVVVVGILLFNCYDEHDEKSVDKHLNMVTCVLFMTVLACEGVRPEFVKEVRVKYEPPPSLLYYQVVTSSFVLLVIFGIFSRDLWHALVFVWEHDSLALDLTLQAGLSAIGDIFVYRVMVLHRQHVIPFIVTIRKLFTSVINIIWFHHHINHMQLLGLAIVAVGLMVQLIRAYQQIRSKPLQSVKYHELAEDEHF